MTPLYKSGLRKYPENYRPISITSQIGKLLEKIARKEMMKHLMENNLLSDHQHGFCDKRPCATNLLETFEDITSLVEEGIPIDELFMDFQKAFDKVSHERLIYKLDKLGIRNTLLLWVESFLSDRFQRVKINGSYSSWSYVSSGVPQGSVLGPLLFVAYINDLPSLMTTNCKLFADDAKLYGRVDTLLNQEELQKDLDACWHWANEWNMVFHPDKCKVIHFGTKNERNIYHIGPNIIHRVSDTKDLGIIVSEDLKWAKHISMCTKKANRMVGLIKHTFSFMDKDMFLVLYRSLIRPLLEYCPQIWSPYYNKDINMLEKVQRRATKLVPSLYDLPYDQRLLHLGLYPLKDRRQRGDMITVYNLINGRINMNVGKVCQFNTGCTATRSHNYQLQGQICRTEMRKNSFSQRIILPWNQLDPYTVLAPSVNSFKERYDKAHLSQYLSNKH